MSAGEEKRAPGPTLVVLGDSLTLPRPGEGLVPAATWPALLARDVGSAALYHRGVGGASIEEIARAYREGFRDYVRRIPGSVCVLEAGIVDGAPRAVPEPVRRAIARLPARVRDPVIAWLHDHRESSQRFFARVLGEVPRRTRLPRFRRVYASLLDQLAGDFDRVVTVGIAPADAAYERKNPGIQESVAVYDAAIRELASAHERVRHLDLCSLFRDGGAGAPLVSERDHHHLTPAGHAAVARALAALLDEASVAPAGGER